MEMLNITFNIRKKLLYCARGETLGWAVEREGDFCPERFPSLAGGGPGQCALGDVLEWT